MGTDIGTSGRHVATVLSRLRIEKEIMGKAKLGQGGAVADFVASGEVEMAIHQISEILIVKGVRLAGPLPAELQKLTTYAAVPALSWLLRRWLVPRRDRKRDRTLRR